MDYSSPIEKRYKNFDILNDISKPFSFYDVYQNIEKTVMLLKSIKNILSFEANDKTTLKEILHPKNDSLALGYSLAHASLKIGESSLPHCLENQSEVYYFLNGSGKIKIGEEYQNITKGDVVLVPAGAKQHVENQGDEMLTFLCIVSPPWKEEDDQLL